MLWHRCRRTVISATPHRSFAATESCTAPPIPACTGRRRVSSGNKRAIRPRTIDDTDRTVISTDRRNSCVEYTGWSFPTEGLAWAPVELSRHDIELPLGHGTQIRAFRKVLA